MATESDHTPAEARPIGLGITTALVAGTIIGSGIFTLPAALAEIGWIAMVGFAISSIGAMLLAMVFAYASNRHPAAGGPYAYAREGFGDFMGFQTAWNYWIGAWVGVAAIGVSAVGYLGELIPALREDRWAQIATAIALVAVLTFVATRGLATGGALSLVLMVLKVVPLLIIGTVGFLAFDAANLGPANATPDSLVDAIGLSVALTLFAYIGVEAASIPGQAVKDPTRTIPRATLIGTGLAAVVYLLSTLAVFGALPNSALAESAAPFSDAARVMFGDWAGPAISLVAVISCLGAMNGLILLAGQMPMAAAKDRLAPGVFGKLNRNSAPAIGLVISGVLAGAMTYFGFGDGGLVEVYTKLLLISTLATLLPYLMVSAAELRFLIVDRAPGTRITRLGVKVAVTSLAVVYSLWAMSQAGTEEVYLGFMLFLVGVPIFVLVLRQLRTPPPPAHESVKPFDVISADPSQSNEGQARN
ncbi:MAG: amino acid permease [Actinobacteria bacterium]|nr:amino acid permease [Actinomycetota bacterium]